jgi:hypothetical protein
MITTQERRREGIFLLPSGKGYYVVILCSVVMKKVFCR